MSRHHRLAVGLQNYKPYFNPTLDREPKSTSVLNYFTRAEQNTLQGSRIVQQLQSILAKTKWDWNIIPLEGHFFSENDYIEAIRVHCEQNNVPLEGHITFGFNGSSGQHITPWMVLHKFGHSVFGDNPCLNIIEPALHTFQGDNPMDSPIYIQPFRIMTFASARNNKLTNSGEAEYELVAQYLTEGSVRFNPKGWTIYNPDVEEDFAKMLLSLTNQVNRAISLRIDGMVGRIVVDQT